MADKKIIMTQEGLDKLKTKLEYLKTVKRYEVADRIKVARGYGDLSENSEYDEAKTEQGFVEGEIAELEERLKNAEVVPDEDIHTDDVSVGSVVKIRDLDDDEPYPIITGDYTGFPAWGPRDVVPGTPIAKPAPVFRKLDDDVVETELARLRGDGEA